MPNTHRLLLLLQVYVCFCCGGQSGQRREQWRLQISPCRGGDSLEWSDAKQHSSFSPSGGKVYCQLAFVVGLKRFAAVSIKRHRSKETPQTEIPTEEGGEEWEGVKLIQTLKTDVKCSSLLFALYPNNNNNNNKNPNHHLMLLFFSLLKLWFLPSLLFFRLSCLVSVVERLISLFPSSHKHTLEGWLPGWWCGRWHHALTVLYSGSRSGRVHGIVAWVGTHSSLCCLHLCLFLFLSSSPPLWALSIGLSSVPCVLWEKD